MDKFSQNLEKEGGMHPAPDKFLLYVDGELTPKEEVQLESHLDACWSCRVRVAKIEETIGDIIEFEDTTARFQINNSTPRWGDFDSLLNNVVQENTRGSLRSRILGLWKYYNQLSLFSLKGKLAVSSLATLLIVAIFYQFVFVSQVSAEEILTKSVTAQKERLNQIDQPVVYQKLRVRRQDQDEMNWEVWRDTVRSRFRQNVTDEGTNRFNNDLWQILQENGFNPQEPLSALTFSNWRKNLSVKTDSVENSKTEDGKELLILKTVNLRADSMGRISTGILKVRSDDFHPVEQILRITTNNGVETYSFKELDFQVVSLNTLKPDFFPESVEPLLTKEQIKTTASPSVEANTTVTPTVEPSLVAQNNNANLTVKPVVVTKVTANTELEIDVLDLLNKAKADLGEQITVSREADGLLYIRGIVETANRKNEILQILQSVRNNPAVRIDLKTVGEAVAEQKNTPKPSGTVERMDTESTETATNSELLAYFKSEQAARAFSGQMISRSSRAMSRAYALKRLVGQFKPDELKQLSPEARAKWLGLVNAHARAFREETESLRRELQTVFDAPNVNATGSFDVNDITAVPKAVTTLLDFATANDRIVISAFTISSGKTRFTAIKTTQFWQSLKNAEAIAAKLQSVK